LSASPPKVVVVFTAGSPSATANNRLFGRSGFAQLLSPVDNTPPTLLFHPAASLIATFPCFGFPGAPSHAAIMVLIPANLVLCGPFGSAYCALMVVFPSVSWCMIGFCSANWNCFFFAVFLHYLLPFLLFRDAFPAGRTQPLRKTPVACKNPGSAKTRVCVQNLALPPRVSPDSFVNRALNSISSNLPGWFATPSFQAGSPVLGNNYPNVTRTVLVSSRLYKLFLFWAWLQRGLTGSGWNA